MFSCQKSNEHALKLSLPPNRPNIKLVDVSSTEVWLQPKMVNPISSVKQDVFRDPRRLFLGKFVCLDGVL